MPQILVVADAPESGVGSVQFREWVAPGLLENEHYAVQLVERMRWAAEDAAAVEQAGTRAAQTSQHARPR